MGHTKLPKPMTNRHWALLSRLEGRRCAVVPMHARRDGHLAKHASHMYALNACSQSETHDAPTVGWWWRGLWMMV